MEKYCSRRSYVRSTAASPGRYNEMGSNQQCEPSTNLSSWVDNAFAALVWHMSHQPNC